MTNVLYAVFQCIPRRCHVAKFAVDVELHVIGKGYNVTPCLTAKSARSAVYNKNNSRPKTDPWERSMHLLDERQSSVVDHIVCAPSLYDRNQANTLSRTPKVRFTVPIAVHDSPYQMLLLNLANREPISVHCGL